MNEIDDNIERTQERIKDTGEVFTPTALVEDMLDDLNIDWQNVPQDKTFLDPTCGNGNFLVELAKRGVPLKNIYGVDLMADNVLLCKHRLLRVCGDNVENTSIVDNNIREGNALEYDYNFRD